MTPSEPVADVPKRPPARGCPRWTVAALALALLLCLGCGALGALSLRGGGVARSQGGPVRIGAGMMDVCAGAVTQPRFQVGVGWQAMILSRTPPAVIFSPYAICVGVPVWPPPLPYRGEWMFPP